MVFHLTARVVSQKKIILFSAITATVHGTEGFLLLHSQTPVTVLLQQIGTELGGASLLKTSEDLLFNKKLPLDFLSQKVLLL